MNTFVDFFLKVRNSKAFSGIVIAVIVASAVYAGVSSYDTHLSTRFTQIYSTMPLPYFS